MRLGGRTLAGCVPWLKEVIGRCGVGGRGAAGNSSLAEVCLRLGQTDQGCPPWLFIVNRPKGALLTTVF